MRHVSEVAVLCAVFLAAVLADTTPCNQGNHALCLDAVKAYLQRTDFWFGDTYASDCPEDVRETKLECRNPDPDRTKVGERIFQRNNYEANNVTQFLRMRYSAGGGSYMACGHRFDVDPLYMWQDVDNTRTLHYDSWSMIRRPGIIWEADPGRFYTLLAYNVGELQLAGLWVNIEGGDSSIGKELHHYRVLIDPFDRVALQAFVLFEQSPKILPTRYKIIQDNIQLYNQQNDGTFRLDNLFAVVPEIKREPIAFGYLATRTSPFSIEYHKTQSNVNNCPWLIQRLRPQSMQIISALNLITGNSSADFRDLELEVQVEFRSEAINYTSCCVYVDQRDTVAPVDPFSTNPIPFVDLRKEPWVKLDSVAEKDSFFFFHGSYFSLFLLDVSTMVAHSTHTRPKLVWHVADINQPHPSDSGITKSYYGMPLPALNSTESNVFVFLVFRQSSGAIGNVSLERYCYGNYTSGCEIDISRLVSENKMRLSGFNIFTSEADLYSRMLMYKANITTKAEACSAVPDYTEPCPTPCPTTTTLSPTTEAPTSPATTPRDTTPATTQVERTISVTDDSRMTTRTDTLTAEATDTTATTAERESTTPSDPVRTTTPPYYTGNNEGFKLSSFPLFVSLTAMISCSYFFVFKMP